MRRLFVIRHGSRIDFEDKYWRSQSPTPYDPPLSELGKRQARETGAFLRQFAIKAVYASPFMRTVETATAIADALDLPIRVECGLSEWLNPRWFDFSAWAPDPLALARAFPRVDLSYESLVFPRYPEAEEALCRHRLRYIVHQLINEQAGDMALVTHGAGVFGLVEALTGSTDGSSDQLCGVNVLQEQNGAWRLVAAVADHLSSTQTTVQYN